VHPIRLSKIYTAKPPPPCGHGNLRQASKLAICPLTRVNLAHSARSLYRLGRPFKISFLLKNYQEGCYHRQTELGYSPRWSLQFVTYLTCGRLFSATTSSESSMLSGVPQLFLADGAESVAFVTLGCARSILCKISSGHSQMQAI